MTILKSLVLCLTLANVGYFLWTRGIDRSQAVPVSSAPASLQLASEVRGEPQLAAGDASGLAGVGTSPDAPADSAAGPAVLPGAVKRCLALGPFRDVAEAAHAASALRRVGYDPRQRVVDGEVWAGVWVYLPVPAGPGVSDQMLSKLKAGGIDDALEMPGPMDGSVISLGLFGEQKRAQARLAQAQSLGFNPGIADRKRTGNVYWIDIDLKPTDGPLNPAELQNEAGRISRLEVKGCPATPTAQP